MFKWWYSWGRMIVREIVSFDLIINKFRMLAFKSLVLTSFAFRLFHWPCHRWIVTYASPLFESLANFLVSRFRLQPKADRPFDVILAWMNRFYKILNWMRYLCWIVSVSRQHCWLSDESRNGERGGLPTLCIWCVWCRARVQLSCRFARKQSTIASKKRTRERRIRNQMSWDCVALSSQRWHPLDNRPPNEPNSL